MLIAYINKIKVPKSMFQNKYLRLTLGIIFDLMGSATFLVPIVSEPFDVLWAPISAFILLQMYPNRTGKIAATLNFIEELLPFFDIIPTFTLTWLYTYVWNKETTKNISDTIEYKSN